MYRYNYNKWLVQKNEEKVTLDRLYGSGEPSLPMKHETEDLEQLVFAPSPVSMLPTSDLALINSGGLSPEMLNLIQSLTMRPISAIGAGSDDDKKALDTALPYQLSNETQLLDYYKAKGYDTDKIERVLQGEAFDSVFTAVSASSDDSSSE